MKILGTFLIFVFLLTCTTTAQEKKNPLEGTTWELTSGKWVREDTTFTSPANPHDHAIMIYGKTHWAYVSQDTSLKLDMSILGTYSVDGDKVTQIYKIAPNYKDIGSSLIYKFQINGDQLILKATDYHWGGYKWKGFDHVWSRIASEEDKNNPLEGTTWEMVSAEYTWGDSIIINPTSNFHKGISIWGKTYTLATWQDTSKQEIFYVGHKYTIEDDTVIFKITYWPDPRFIGRTFKLKYEIKENELILNGVIPEKKWRLHDHEMKLHEVWKRID